MVAETSRREKLLHFLASGTFQQVFKSANEGGVGIDCIIRFMTFYDDWHSKKLIICNEFDSKKYFHS